MFVCLYFMRFHTVHPISIKLSKLIASTCAKALQIGATGASYANKITNKRFIFIYRFYWNITECFLLAINNLLSNH